MRNIILKVDISPFVSSNGGGLLLKWYPDCKLKYAQDLGTRQIVFPLLQFKRICMVQAQSRIFNKRSEDYSSIPVFC